MARAENRDFTSQLVDLLTEHPKIIPIPPLPTSIPIPTSLRAEELEDIYHTYPMEAGNPLRAIGQVFDQIYVHFFQTALSEHPNAASAGKIAQREFILCINELARKQGFIVSQVSVKDDSPYTGEHVELHVSAIIPVDGIPTKVPFYSRPLQDFTPPDFFMSHRG